MAFTLLGLEVDLRAGVDTLDGPPDVRAGVTTGRKEESRDRCATSSALDAKLFGDDFLVYDSFIYGKPACDSSPSEGIPTEPFRW